jgi:hypothetical protein
MVALVTAVQAVGIKKVDNINFFEVLEWLNRIIKSDE